MLYFLVGWPGQGSISLCVCSNSFFIKAVLCVWMLLYKRVPITTVVESVPAERFTSAAEDVNLKCVSVNTNHLC